MNTKTREKNKTKNKTKNGAIAPPLDLELIGQNIARARGRLHLTQFQLAETIGVHPNYVSQLECGRKEPSLSLLSRIREALCLSWEETFHDESEGGGPSNGRKIEEFERRRMLRAAERIGTEGRSAVIRMMELLAQAPVGKLEKLEKSEKSAAPPPAPRRGRPKKQR